MRSKPLFFSVLLFALLAGGEARAQNRLAKSKPTLPPLKENVTIEIKGAVAGGASFDETWTGVGPDFNLEWVHPIEGGAPQTASCRGTISATPNGYLVNCTVDTELPAVTRIVTGIATQTNYTSIGTATTVLLTPGETETLLSHAGQTLTITLVKATADYASQQQPIPPSNPPPLDDNVKINFSGLWMDNATLNFTAVTTGLLNAGIKETGPEVNGVKLILIKQCEGTISAMGDGYLLQYVATANIPILTSTSDKNVQSVTYHPGGGTSSVMLKLDEPVTVFQVDGQSLTLKVSKVGNP